MKHKKSLALLASAAITVSSVSPAFTAAALAEGTGKYKDGEYTVTKTVSPDEDKDFSDYDLNVTVKVENGAVSSISAEQGKGEDGDNNKYIDKALNGKGNKVGLIDQIREKQSTDGLDMVSGATCSSKAIIEAVQDALESAKLPEQTSADKTALQAAVADAETKNQDDYTAESWAGFAEALAKAKEILAKEDASQDEVNAAKAALETAAAALAKKPAQADKAALEKAIADAVKEQGTYTDDSWKAYQTALKNAKDVFADVTASQDEVNAAKAALETAAAALAKKPAQADKAALEKAIADAVKEQGTYTDDSWKAYQTALKNAEDVFADVTATQDEVNAACKALTDAQNALAEKQPEAGKGVYALMNIPYDDFYKAELNGNDVKVDGVTSATKNKTRTGSLVGGSYHVNADGADITGVIYPVKLNSQDAVKGLTQITDDSKVTIEVAKHGKTSTTDYTGKDALFESASYSYYVLSEEPAAYKEASVDKNGNWSFGEVKTNQTTNLTEASAELKTTSNYGDYQINIENLPAEIGNISAVILKTKEGESYGLRHLENIWHQRKLAFSTGFTTEVHGCPVRGDHYRSIMGKTITGITYITQNGEYNIAANLYVPIKTGIKATVENFTEGANETKLTLTEELPGEFTPVYSVDGTEVTAENGTLHYENAKPGKHTLTIADKNGKYNEITAEFTVASSAEGENIVSIDSQSGSLVAANESGVDVANFAQNIENVTVNGKTYFTTGRGAVSLFFENGYLDITAAPIASGFKAGAQYEMSIQAAGYPTVSFTYTVPDTIYAYANLTYGEYWAAEGVQAAGDTSASNVQDSRKELDKGAFDAVSRATSNHGLHRGSFQQSAVIHTENGKDLYISHWSEDGKTIYLTDGSTVGYSRGTITYKDGSSDNLKSYEITGIKYVPVAVDANDFTAFVANRGALNVVVNGGSMAGGYGEYNLQSYTAAAEVTANTNGLKTAVKNADGSFSFSKRSTGADSGLIGSSLQTADNNNITATVKPANGSYGEFLRVDLTGAGYGALGDKMQTVQWTYYGTDSTRQNALATYGTKFAADNWMHKSMGIQLGLTESARCTLPAGTDGTGYWSLTVYALGYEDYTVQFKATSENIVAGNVSVVAGDFTQLKELADQAKQKNESDYTAESWAQFKAELDETDEMIAANTATQAMINEQITHLQNAMDHLVTVPGNFDASKKLVKQAGEKQEGDYTAESWAAFQAELGKLNAMIAAGTAPQSEINAQYIALENAMKALTKKNSSGSSHSSSSSSSSSSTTNNTTNNTTTNNTTVQAAPVSAAGTSPKTGDPTSLFGWMAAGLGSIGGLGALIRKRRK